MISPCTCLPAMAIVISTSIAVPGLAGTAGDPPTNAPRPPVARIIPHETVIHGQTLIDHYYWMRKRDSAEVRAYLRAENDYAEKLMKPTEALQERLYQEIKGRIKETDETVPYPYGDYYYYTRSVEGRQYRINCRRHGSLEGKEEVLLDENVLAKGHDYFDLRGFEVNPDHRLLAYATDTSGAEQYVIRVKDLETGRTYDEAIANTAGNIGWANDSRTFFYTVLDDARRPFKVLRHRLGTDPSNDALIHEEKDDRFRVYLVRSRSGRFVFLAVGSAITHEWHYLEADTPDGPFKVIAPRRQGVEYSPAHQGDRFLILTNDEAVNFRLMEAPVSNPSRAHWREVIPHRPTGRLEHVDAFKDYVVIYERSDGLKKIRVHHGPRGEVHHVDFPEPAYSTYPEANKVYDTATLRFAYSSLITPKSVYDYDMRARTRRLMKREEVLGGYDPVNYESRRVYATGADGARVPISMAYRKGMRPPGGQPTMLLGYGAYGFSMDPFFMPSMPSLLDRGLIVAIAHVRGGSEMGRMWYEDGKFLKKKNTFTDFIACAEHLVAENYTTSDQLAIMGASAGGLLIGAVVNARPELFEVAVAQVPFVDLINTMLDESLPLTATEWEEWGNPKEKQYFDYMLSYSPYDNVRQQSYPHLLVTAGLNDPRVQYWEPAKWTAKLRAHKTDDHWLLLKTNMGAGHGGASGRYDAIRERAFVWAFVLDRLGITP